MQSPCFVYASTYRNEINEGGGSIEGPYLWMVGPVTVPECGYSNGTYSPVPNFYFVHYNTDPYQQFIHKCDALYTL